MPYETWAREGLLTATPGNVVAVGPASILDTDDNYT